MAEPAGPRRRAHAWIWLVASGVVVTGVVLAAAGFGGVRRAPGAADAKPSGTATVTRTDLVDYLDVTGVLGYGRATTVAARAAAGTITWLPAAGSTIRRGQRLYAVDALPVTLLYGPLPAYRSLHTGVTGDDVRQLGDNLRALGYRGFTVGTTFDDALAAAVRRWQAALGLPATGAVDPSQVVYAPDAVRVAQVRLSVGDPASGQVLSYTGTVRLVSVDLPVDDARMVSVGAQVSVTMPGADPATATVSDIAGAVSGGTGTGAGGDGTGGTGGRGSGTANGSGGTGDGSGGGNQPTIAVTLRLGDQTRGYPYDGTSVTVRLVAQRRSHVLCVPVEALLALREGGFGVEVVEGGATHVVPVTPGLFADGKVEIPDGQLAEGAKVAMPG